MTFNHLKTYSTKLAHYRLKIRNVIEYSDFQSLMQHSLLSRFQSLDQSQLGEHAFLRSWGGESLTNIILIII